MKVKDRFGRTSEEIRMEMHFLAWRTRILGVVHGSRFHVSCFMCGNPATAGARAVQPCDFPCIARPEPERSLQLSCERGRASSIALFRTLMTTLLEFREARESHSHRSSDEADPVEITIDEKEK